MSGRTRRGVPRPIPEPVLLVGPVSRDQVAHRIQLGGAVTYGAQVVTAFGLRGRILTIVNADTDISALADHAVTAAEDRQALSLRIDRGPLGRELSLVSRPSRALTAGDLPATWRYPRTLILGPLLQGDLDLQSFVPIAARADRVGILTQGLQRRPEPLVRVGPPAEAETLIAIASPAVTLVRSEREATHWPASLEHAILAAGARLVTTYGRAGADIREGSQHTVIPPTHVVEETEATGAGDVFATALILGLGRGMTAAGQQAAAFAAASIHQRGPGRLPLLKEIEREVAVLTEPAITRDPPG